MAYKQKGCTPITAKLKKTTKGGMVQQPLLNMGAPVKMKSPAKQGGRYNRRSATEHRLKNKKQDFADFSKKRNSDIERLSAETNAMQKAISNYESKSGTKAPKSDYNYLNKAKTKLKDRQASAAGEAAMLADSEARKNKTGLYAPKPRKIVKKEKATVKTESLKAAKIAKIETKAPDVAIIDKIITPNNNSKVLDKKTIKKVDRKTKSAERKESRAARVRQKGIEALKSGNKQKALRLKRREERINKRAAKKRGQASKAINPDK